jgi:type II secretory pathway component PulM
MSLATLAAIVIAGLAPNDWAMLGACFALALAAVIFVFFIQPDASDLAPHRSKLDQLLERRDTIYENLRDLRFEYRAGKYSEGDYEAMKNSLELEVAQVLVEIDQVTETQTKRARGAKTSAVQESGR